MTDKLPILLSIPHSGPNIPPELEHLNLLTADQIIKDGDVGGDEIYALDEHFAKVIRADVARAFVDLNRSEDDRRMDGVVKTHTCWEEPVYQQALSEELSKQLLDKYYHPYHQRLNQINDNEIKLCVDCHTMAEFGPPVGPDAGQARPHVCLGDNKGQTLPDGWIQILAECFVEYFGESVTVNQPFSGGYITRTHGLSRPWLQLELSRGNFMSNEQKRIGVLNSLKRFAKLALK